MARSVAAAALLVSLAFAGVARAEAPPSEAYVLHCSGCHGPDGAGHEGFVPSLRDLDALLARPGGRAYLARVPGVAQAPIDDAQLTALLNWVLTEISNSQDLEPYRTDEVGALRRHPLRDPLAVRP